MLANTKGKASLAKPADNKAVCSPFSTKTRRPLVQGAGEPPPVALAEKQRGSHHHGRCFVAPARLDAARHPEHPSGVQHRKCVVAFLLLSLILAYRVLWNNSCFSYWVGRDNQR